MHKHCHLNKWEIWDYTLPQVEVLCARVHRYIQFEISTRMPMIPFMGGGDISTSTEIRNNDNNSGEYEEVTSDDVDLLAKILGGG